MPARQEVATRANFVQSLERVLPDKKANFLEIPPSARNLHASVTSRNMNDDFQQQARRAILAYLEHLGAAKLEPLLLLFAPGARVHSPLYGTQSAPHFFQRLLNETARSQLELQALYFSDHKPEACARCHYHWTLRTGRRTTFEVVDVFTFDSEGKITELKIIYDTHPVRKEIANE